MRRAFRRVVVAAVVAMTFITCVVIVVRPMRPDVLSVDAASTSIGADVTTQSPSPTTTPSTTPPAGGGQSCDMGPVLSLFCHVGQGIDSLPGQVAGAVASDVGTSIVNAVTSWVASGAAWALDQVAGLLDESTTPDLDSAWFRRDYATMAELAALCIAVFLFAATIQGLLRGDPGAIARAYLLHAPLAIVGTLVAGAFVDRALAVTDAMSSSVTASMHDDIAAFTGHVVEALAVATGGHAGAALFVVFLGAIGVAITALILWLELIVRQAAVDICVLFLPLTLSAAVWPETARWTRHLLHTLAAIILSKFVIVAVLALSVSALAAGTTGGGVKAILIGVVLLALAAYCPWAVLRLLPAMSASAATSLTGLGRRGVAWATPAPYRPSALAEHLVRSRSASAAAPGGSSVSAGLVGAGGAGAAAALVTARRVAGSLREGSRSAVPSWTVASGRGASASAAEAAPSVNPPADRPGESSPMRWGPRRIQSEEDSDV